MSTSTEIPIEFLLPPELHALDNAELNNPIWHSLNGDHATLAITNEGTRRYPSNIGPLSGFAQQSDANYDALIPLATDGPVVLFLEEPTNVPASTRLVLTGMLYQMAHYHPEQVTLSPVPTDVTLRPLNAADAEQMLELATLTEPGPFRIDTYQLGQFHGIFHQNQLLAMAGQRTRVTGFTEVSAVCTHPTARGRGFAQLVMERVIQDIAAEGRRPFLHCYVHNTAAIRLYERMGFVKRRSFPFAVVAAADWQSSKENGF